MLVHFLVTVVDSQDAADIDFDIVFETLVIITLIVRLKRVNNMRISAV